MKEGVARGRIDTVHTRHTPEAMGRAPRVDRHGGEVYVYRRPGQPCLACGTAVARGPLAGRNLYWCPACQPDT
jgi:endonuclease-8